MNLKSKKGFTLVELIIVIAILGIIALIAVPSLTGVQKRSQVNADIRTAEQIGKAVRIWLTDADINTANDREDIIDGGYVALNPATAGAASALTGIEGYISADYKPQALSASKYYITLAKGDKIVVAISADALSTDKVETLYALDATETAVAGVAYVEGITALTTAVIPDMT